MAESQFAIGLIVTNPGVVDTMRRDVAEEKSLGLRPAGQPLFTRFFPRQEMQGDSEADRSITLLTYKYVITITEKDAICQLARETEDFLQCVRKTCTLYPDLRLCADPAVVRFGEGCRIKFMGAGQ